MWVCYEKKQKGTTLLYLTSLMGNFKAMELLILNGALVNAKNDVSVWIWLLFFFLSFSCCGWSSLHISFSFDWVILMIHLKKHVNTQHKSHYGCHQRGFAPLHVAAQEGRVEVIHFLVKHGASLNVLNLV
jgi:hypothetical protein